MIFAASIVYFAPENYKKVKKAVESFKNAEIHFHDENEGKMVIVIEGEDSNDLENVRLKLIEEPFIDDVAHYAFHFGEEVEKVMEGTPIKDFDIETAFKKHNKK